MSTNPNNAVGTNGAYGGRTSVNALNDILGAFSSGIVSGWACSPDSGLTVTLGGDGTTRDVAIAEDNSGNKTTINNISGSPISVTMSAAPATNSRIDLIVAYVDNPPQGTSTQTDNPGACGIIKVTGTAASTPIAPNDSAIRTAITADGASGATAYYVILAQITIASGTTDLVAGNITAGTFASLNNNQIANFSISGDKLNFVASSISISKSSKVGDDNITVRQFSGLINFQGFANVTTEIAQNARIFTILNMPQTLGDQRIQVTTTTGVKYLYIKYTGDVINDVGTIPPGTYIFDSTLML